MTTAFRNIPISGGIARIGPVHARRLYSVYCTLNEIQAGVLSDAQIAVRARMSATALADLFPFIADIVKSEVDNG